MSVRPLARMLEILCKVCNQCDIQHSNTPRLYSQWLNSVIYWLIIHCTDWARTGVESLGRQFDFHDVIYPIRHCNVDIRRRSIVFTTIGHSKCT